MGSTIQSTGSSTLEKWLTWLKSTFVLNVKTIIIDCSPTEIAAIKNVFKEEVQVLLCHWHIKRAWETNIKKYIKVDRATHETENRRDAIRASLNGLMYLKTCEQFQLSLDLFKLKYADCNQFLEYFDKYWVPKKANWCLAWSETASFRTNNLIESYHNQIKTLYFGRSRNLRVDHLLYLLSKVIIIDYRLDNLRTFLGFQDPRLTATEEKKRKKAERIDSITRRSMVKRVDDNTFSCHSFNFDDTDTDSDIIYILILKNNYLYSCSCGDNSSICKHIFLVHYSENIPYSLRWSSSSINDPFSVIAAEDIGSYTKHEKKENDTNNDQDSLRRAEYLENIVKYYNIFTNTYKRKMSQIKNNNVHLNEMEDTLKRFSSIIDEIGVASASLPSRQT